jgi:prepilin-type N-terminal cleavage/methylation domain-containing protein
VTRTTPCNPRGIGPHSLRERAGVRGRVELRRRLRAFTLIETMLAVLIMALLASAAALSFAAPLRAARSREALDQIFAADRAARQLSRDAARPVRLSFDPSNGVVARFSGGQMQSRIVLPASFQIGAVLVGRRAFRSSIADIEFSTSGFSPTYAVHLAGPGINCWIVFAGLTGQTSVMSDEESVRWAIDNIAPSRHNPD